MRQTIQQWLTSKTLLVFGAALFISGCNVEQQQQGQQPLAPAVSVATVIEQNITEWDEFTGRLQAPQSVELKPRVSGYIEKILFKEGAEVKAGDVLLHIDARSLRAEVSRLQAELSSARSQLSLANSEYDRAKKLLSQKAISNEVVDNRLAQQQRTQATVKSVSAALDIARLNVSYAQVKSPIDGRVSSASATKGNFVNAGQTVLTSIVSTDRMYAYFDADERSYLNQVKLARQADNGGAAQVSAEDGGKNLKSSNRGLIKSPVYMALVSDQDYPYEGYIDFIDNKVDPETGTIRSRAVFDNTDGLLIPGLFVRLKQIASAPYDAILIDDKAIGTDLNKKFVLVLDENNVVQYRPVVLGTKVSGLRIISSGLQAGEKIVVNGLQRVRPGTPVTPEVVEMANDSILQNLKSMQQRVEQLHEQQQLTGRAQELDQTTRGG